MTKSINDKLREREHLFAGYGGQVLATPLLAGILLCIFFWLFGYDVNLLLTNAGILAVWLVLVIFAFLRHPHGEVWRNYRWIIAPAILILLFLFNTSWAQSTLATSSLKKSVFKETSLDSLQFHAEYPSQILFDDAEPSEIHLWVTGLPNCTNLTISGQGLVFAVKPTSDDMSIKWSDTLDIRFEKETNATTLLIQPSKAPELDSRSIQLKLDSNGKSLETADWLVIVESKRDSQVRNWKKNFLATSSTIVSLITAIFVGIKQLDEEKKRQETKQIDQAIASFDDDLARDFSGTLKKHLDLTADWNEWDEGLRIQYRTKWFILIKDKLWDLLSNQTITDLQINTEKCLELCKKIFEHHDEGDLLLTLQQLQSALRQDGQSLLSLVRDHPDSVTIAKRIVKNYPTEIKTLIIEKLREEYKNEIKLLSREFGFPDEYPLLESLFWHYRVSNPDTRETKEWLSLHKLILSPFADADNPFTSLPEHHESFLIDFTPTGFSFDLPSEKQTYFKFNDPWDLRTAIYRFCKTLPASIASQAFLVLSPPSLLIDFEKDSVGIWVLHALAEQWLNIVADKPTTFYDLDVYQQKVLARLLSWHFGSMHSVLTRLSKEIGNRFALISSEIQQQSQEERIKEINAKEFLKKAPIWLEGAISTPIQPTELPSLVDLRPSSTHRTFLLIPSIDLNAQSEINITFEQHKAFDAITDWLQIHNYSLIHFCLDNQEWQQINKDMLIQILNKRIKHCVTQEELPLDQRITTLNDLFIKHSEKSAEYLLAEKAAGSPGKMVRLGQKLLLQHVEKYSPDELLHIEDLIALE